MEIPVSAMPQYLRQDVLEERKKLIEANKINEDVQDIFHLFSEDLQIRLLDFVESRKRPQVHGAGDEYDFTPEDGSYKAPKDYKDKVEAVRIAFTAENFRPGIPSETVSETKNTMENRISPKSEEESKRESVLAAFTSRPVVKETK